MPLGTMFVSMPKLPPEVVLMSVTCASAKGHEGIHVPSAAKDHNDVHGLCCCRKSCWGLVCAVDIHSLCSQRMPCCGLCYHLRPSMWLSLFCAHT